MIPLRGVFLACVVVWGLGLMVGCNRPAVPTGEEGTRSATSETAKPATPEDRGQKESVPSGGKSTEAVARPEPAATASLKSAKSVLEAMAAAYKMATSYADKGTLRIRAVQGTQKVDQTLDYALVMVRPNKVRLQVFEGVMVCNGQHLEAFVNDLPGQIVQRPAPPKIDIKTVFADRILASAISQGPTQGFSWVPISLLLMTVDDPLKTILYRSAQPVLLEPAKIGDRDCYRVQLVRPDGVAILWIDQESLLLRRMDFPFEELVRSAGEPKLENVSLSAEFADAALDAAVDPSAFKQEIPAKAQVGEWLLPPQFLLLGKPVPDFRFVGPDGKAIEAKAMEGNVAVLQFWATGSTQCRVGLSIVEKLYKKYQENPRVRFLAVSVDPAKIDDKELKAMLEETNVTVPYARDPDEHARRFSLQGIPSTCVIGPNKIVQDYQPGYSPTMEADLSTKIEKLLAGQDTYRDPLDQFDAQRKDYTAWLGKQIEKGIYVGEAVQEQEIPEAKIAPRSEPKAFALEPLWKCTELKSPGNMLVVPAASGPPKLLVLDSWKTVAEITPQGKVAAARALDLPEREAATFIRSGVGDDKKRYYAVSGIMQQQVHLYDENWKRLLSYPEDAYKNPHAGIADVQLADLDGDGKLEILVSYYQDVGVQCVSLEGKRIWPNRTVAMVSRIAVWDPEPKGPRSLLCTNSLGSLVMLDAQGKRQGEINVPNRLIHWVVTADLLGDQRMEIAGLYLAELGASVLIGIDPKGGELWSHPLPKGVHRRPVEQIVAGNLAPSGPGQWLVPGPDGSIFAIAADGRLVDHWQTGVVISGLATALADGQPVLVVTSTDAVGAAGVVEAWRVRWPTGQK